MTSRVQKGGTLFKPVGKARTRAVGSVAPRQESVAVEVTRTDVPQLAVSQPAASAESEAQSANQLSASVERPTNIKHTPAPASNAQPLFLPAHDPTDNVPDTPSEPDFPPTFSVAIFPHPRPPHSVATASTIQPSYHPTPPPVPEFVQGSSSGVPITIGQPTQPPASLQSLESAIQPDPNFSQPESTKGRRKRKQSVTEGEGDGAGPKRARSRASSGTPNPRKRPSPPPYDPDADPGEEIDPTTTTMASLCIDTGQGRVSSKAAEILTNHATWKAKNRERRARMKALMEAKKYGRSEDIDQEPEHGESSTTPNENPPDQTAENEEVNEYNYTKNLATSRFNVQVRIGPNGETIIDEDSLVVDRVEADSTQNYTHVVESDHSKFVNSGSYGKRFRGSRWSAEETEMFYDALAQYGENYELIAYILPGRDRKSCKNKFKVEDKKNSARINHVLNNRIPVDINTLSRITGKDFSGPTPEIRAPRPPPPPPPPELPAETENRPTHEPSKAVKRRSRSRSAAEAGVLILGSAEQFQDND